MADYRAAILRGKQEAARLHRQLDIRTNVEQTGGRIDVFGTYLQCGVPLLFKPLDGLLGVFMDIPMPGVLITTRRPLSVQRFTGAHELGHFRLGHRPSLDDESMLRRSPFEIQSNYSQQELEADAFATEFMLPRWLFTMHINRQKWTPAMIQNPLIVYQLSLRVGASYEATCRSLARPGVQMIGRDTLRALLKVKPKEIKKRLLAGYTPKDWWGDVWLLTQDDEGCTIEGSRSDLFIIRMTEHSSAGYTWDFDEINKTGFAVVRDERVVVDGEEIGTFNTRQVVTQSSDRQSGDIVLSERRPWLADDQPLAVFRIHYGLSGPEEEGWSQAERRRFVEAA